MLKSKNMSVHTILIQGKKILLIGTISDTYYIRHITFYILSTNLIYIYLKLHTTHTLNINRIRSINNETQLTKKKMIIEYSMIIGHTKYTIERYIIDYYIHSNIIQPLLETLLMLKQNRSLECYFLGNLSSLK